MKKQRDLLDLRLDAGLTQQKVASALHIQPCNVSFWEHGHTRPHPLRRRQLARLYGVSLKEIDAAIEASAMPN